MCTHESLKILYSFGPGHVLCFFFLFFSCMKLVSGGNTVGVSEPHLKLVIELGMEKIFLFGKTVGSSMLVLW